MQLRQFLKWNISCLFAIAIISGPSLGADSTSTHKDSTSTLMEMDLTDLMNMQVTTTSKQAEKISDAPGVISVITHDEMERFGARTLKDVLLRVPSFALSTIYMTDRSTIAARGDQLNPAACHTLLLINGRPVREAEEGGIKSEMYESFPISVIDHIEVIRGPGSVLYGSNAFSAVINVITKKGSENQTNLKVQGGYPAAFLGDGSVAYQFGDFSIIAGVKYYDEKNWDLTYEGKDGITKRDISIPNNGLGSYVELDYKNFKIVSSYNNWQNFYAFQKYIPTTPPPINTRQAYGNVLYQKWFNDFGYTPKITDWWNMSFNATYTQSLLDVDSFPAPHRNSFDLTGEWTNFFKPINNFNIVFGILGNYVQGTQSSGLPSTSVLDTSRSSLGIYLQADYKVFPTLKLIGGLQGNKVPGFDFDLNPRAGLIWSPLEVVNVKALYSQAFRAPSIQELYIQSATIKGYPDLKPEKVNTVDLGVNIQTDKASIGLNNFYSRITNTIYQRTTLQPVRYANSDQKTTIIGMELEGKWYILKELLLTGSGLYQQNTNNDSLGNMMPIPSAGAKGGISYTANGFTASAFDIYEGKLDKRYTSIGNPNPGQYNILNLNVQYDLNKLLHVKALGKIAVCIEAYDLLNKEVWLPATGLVTSSSLPVIQGRSLFGGINATF